MTWKDITLEQFIQIQDILQNEDNACVLIASLLTNKNINEVSISEVKKKIDQLSFLRTAIPKEKVKNNYTINGVEYILTSDINKISTAQYLDYITYSKENKVENTAKRLACFLIPKGKIYNTDYDKDKVINDIDKYLDIVTVNAIVFFLMKQSQKYILHTIGYLMKQAKKLKKKKEVTKQTHQPSMVL